MCTVTWVHHPDGYSLFCNRDERNSRQPALGPRTGELRGVRYIAPVDGDHGGSWIGVNEFGLSLCLLNRYGDMLRDDTRVYISRGLLLTSLLHSRNAQEVSDAIDEFDLKRFLPFNLLALTCEAEPILLEWNGFKYSATARVESPLTSTSLVDPDIAVARAAQFHSLMSEGAITPLVLEQYHRSHVPARGPTSVCMHRHEAKTVSLSKVSVGKGGIVFEYEPGSPCEKNEPQTMRITI